ncbi:L-rhamnonate dehydratase [Jiangella asiatica]|uniref:L-rhamnonate dehydratase n=1 Tax=Jiangella asiatica TaxID=2530372 RepID=A0A4R5CN69_9ACTN|nr:L-rhamnonate dehydratase [Jiangella asiatica]TDD99014.1 L-rhamnonate dehydratase [Jiangella asiatica]
MSATPPDRIVAVRTFVEDAPPPPDPAPKPEATHWLQGKVANPMTKYAEFRDNRQSAIGPRANRGIVVEVESASGHVGHATTSGGLATAAIIQQHLEYLVVGERASAHGRLWDRMFSSTLLYGRKGIVLHAISGVDLALWDLHGKAVGEPVHALLGGKIRDAVRVYATGPEPATARDLGFAGSKLPLTYAPCEGEDGLRRNVEIAAAARDKLPADFPIMYDCWMSLDVDYAARLAAAVADLGVAWIEEPLPPDDYAGLRRLRDRMPASMMLTTGEHEYTAAGFRLLCEAGVDVLQPDPAWCGGLTELLRISAIAQVFGVKVIPHVGGMPAYHFVATRPDGDLAEFPVLSADGGSVTGQHAPLFTGEVLPVDGWITPNDEPGFGLTLSPEAKLRPALAALAAPA